jgi:Fe-S cluster assembly scaffold protein SufB
MPDPIASAEVNPNPPVEAKYTTNYAASGKPYYHMSYVLNAQNIVSVEQLTKQEFMQNGGQFEVRIDKSAFPIPAPNCQSELILRMPWVPPNQDLSKKYQLYQGINAVRTHQAENLEIVVELNPYVQVTEQGITLTQCNLFFRHANSHYVPHTNPLKQ